MACGLLFVFSGPSASGKNTIMKAAMERNPALTQLPTATTRPIRRDERQGREHEFITEDDFRQRIRNKQLIEWQIIHDKGVYGVPRATIQSAIEKGQPVVADVDVLGAMQLKQEFKDRLVLIFVSVPDIETLERRLRNRSDFTDEGHLQARIRRADFEMEFQDQYDHVIINRDGELDAAVDEALAIIEKECTRQRNNNTVVTGWNPDDIQQHVVGIVVQDTKVLLHNGQFPKLILDNQSNLLPFDAITEFLQQQLKISVRPSRLDAGYRQVDAGFEAPQVVRSMMSDDIIKKTLYYVLYAAEPLNNLPPGWELMEINRLSLDSALQNAIDEARILLQAD